MTRIMTLVFCIFLLGACAKTHTDSATTPHDTSPSEADIFIETVKTNYPVTLSKVADNVWVHTTNYRLPGREPIPSNGLVVQDGEDIILVDGAWGELATKSLLLSIKEDIGMDVTKMIITHHHPDRIAGVDVAELEGIEIFTHPDTPVLAAANGFPVPNTSVASLKEVGARAKVGNVELSYPGVAHAQDNLIVYIAGANILYGGYAVKGVGVKGLGNIVDADTELWVESLNWVKETYPETKLVVPSHGNGADLTLIDDTLALLTAHNETVKLENIDK